MCKSVRSMKSGFWFSFGFIVGLLIVTIGCFALTETGLDLLVPEEDTTIPVAVSVAVTAIPVAATDVPVVTALEEPDNFKVACYRLGGQLWTAAGDTRNLMGHTVFSDMTQDNTEMQVSIMLAYGHLVHARMFLGRAMQAYGDESFYNAKE